MENVIKVHNLHLIMLKSMKVLSELIEMLSIYLQSRNVNKRNPIG